MFRVVAVEGGAAVRGTQGRELARRRARSTVAFSVLAVKLFHFGQDVVDQPLGLEEDFRIAGADRT